MTGCGTCALDTTTELPSTRASAAPHGPSAAAKGQLNTYRNTMKPDLKARGKRGKGTHQDWQWHALGKTVSAVLHGPRPKPDLRMNRPSSFVQWDTAVFKHGAVVMRLNDVERRHAMADGEPFAAIFPAKANFDFDPDLKRNTVLVDFMLNKEDVLLCSERVKDFVQARKPAHLEYLPVTVLDHKGKPVGAPYFILHPIEPPECIDRANSRLTTSEFDLDDIWEAEHLSIDEGRVPADRLIFRPKAYNAVILMRRELAQDLVAAGFTGAGWKEID